MKVKIINGSGWYKDKVGEVFEVEEISLSYEYIVYQSKLKHVRAYISMKDCEEIQETIIIKNRNFLVLEGLESKNKWDMKTKIRFIHDEYIEVIENGYICVHIDLRENMNVSNEYLIERLAQYGFYIEFQDVEDIDTFDKLQDFLFDNRELVMSYDKRKCVVFGELDNEDGLSENDWYSLEEIEERYNVKLSILRSDV